MAIPAVYTEGGAKVLRELLIIMNVLLLGLIVGLWSARMTADMPALAGTVQAGAWRAWPRAGVADALPYAHLRHYLDDALPPSPGDRLELVAETDDDGRPLSGRCAYRLSGAMLPVRNWILTVHDPERREHPLAALQAADALYRPDGTLHILLDPHFQTGNWLQTPRRATYRLVLHLFGISPLQRDRILGAGLLRITRVDCS